MKSITIELMIFSFILLIFYGCEKEKDEINLHNLLTGSEVWTGSKFLVNDENTMPPENSSILDGPVTLLTLKFESDGTLFMRIILEQGLTDDDSGEMEMSWTLNESNQTIDIEDNNSWTQNAPFTATYTIERINENEIVLKGNTDEFKYEIYFKK